MELPQVDNYQQLFLNDTPLLDVRAPVEFAQGAFPAAKNLPLINDAERHAIGIRYKEMGQEQAIELGHELVNAEIKEQRVNDWTAFTRQHPDGVLYCFRGGMRSRISQQWIYDETGVVYPRVKGGYKALRRYLIDELEISAAEIRPIVLSGRTGSGKTILLKLIHDKIDLESIFNHRGSAFGKHVTPQPSQIDVENQLSIELLKFRKNNIYKLLLEDEAVAIGSRRLPDSIVETMRQSPLIILEAGADERVANIFNEYITQALAEHQAMLGEAQGFNTWANGLLTALEKIQRRLGGAHSKAIKSVMEYAINMHRNCAEPDHHKVWIRSLLLEYYDPMYDYQLDKKTERVVFRGTQDEVLNYLIQQQGVR
ncbi:MAG: tRNA 2-selenouridine(34) synthase MnmH [Gammaproteobacteria bacterium]|nr:tRNA 2-selenouridine(34) synthase MnmH [Gammaproteobacteria bacterium]